MTPHPKTLAQRAEPPKGTKLLDWATFYARLGFRVLPCRPQGKNPILERWPERATDDPELVVGWWTRWPDANIGIALGEVVVLDFDPHSGGDYWDSLGLPATPVVHTGSGGRHFYFRLPEGLSEERRSMLKNGRLMEGVDLKVVGGYVIAPPSIHPETKQPYVWEVGAELWAVDLAPLPDWVWDELARHQKGGTARPWEVEVIHEGSRNIALFKYACSLRARGLDEGAIRDRLSQLNAEKCIPPLSEREVAQIAKSAARYEPRRTPFGADKGETKERRPRKSGRERAREILSQARWVLYKERIYIERGGELFSIDEADQYLYKEGLAISKHTATEVAMQESRVADGEGRIEQLDGALVLLDRPPKYGVVDGHEGLFFRHKGKVWCYTKEGRLIEFTGKVYYRPRAHLMSMPQGTIEDLLRYIKVTMANLEKPENPLVALAAVAPTLLGMAKAGILLEGPGGAGKSTAGKALYRLAYLKKAPSILGDSQRDLLAVMGERQIVFHDDTRAMKTDQEDLLRIGITSAPTNIRELYKQDTLELELDLTAILCGVNVTFEDPTTMERFIRFSFAPKRRDSESALEEFQREMAPRALGGLLALYSLASRIPPPPASENAWVRLRDWYSWAIRFARALQVEDEFLRWLDEMNGALLAGLGEWAELYHMLRSGALGEGKHKLADIARMVAERSGLDNTKSEVTRLVSKARARETQQILHTIAGRAGYEIRIFRDWDSTARKERFFVDLKPKKFDEADLEGDKAWASEVTAKILSHPSMYAELTGGADTPTPEVADMAIEGAEALATAAPSTAKAEMATEKAPTPEVAEMAMNKMATEGAKVAIDPAELEKARRAVRHVFERPCLVGVPAGADWIDYSAFVQAVREYEESLESTYARVAEAVNRVTRQAWPRLAEAIRTGSRVEGLLGLGLALDSLDALLIKVRTKDNDPEAFLALKEAIYPIRLVALICELWNFVLSHSPFWASEVRKAWELIEKRDLDGAVKALRGLAERADDSKIRFYGLVAAEFEQTRQRDKQICNMLLKTS